MNTYLKKYLYRGLVFGGFGPIIAGIVNLCLDLSLKGVSITGLGFFSAVTSTYILAFICAGSSVFYQIEEWSLAKSLTFHLLSYYFAYVFCYLINVWIPFDVKFILIFTAVFIVVYFIIWAAMYASVRLTGRKMSNRLNK